MKNIMYSAVNLALIIVAAYSSAFAVQAAAQDSHGAMPAINSYLLLEGKSPVAPPPPPPPIPQNSGVSWVEGEGINGASRDRWQPFSNLDWDNFMGDYVNSTNTAQGNSPFVIATPTGQGQWLDINVTSLVNKWLDKSLENHGFRIQTLTTGIKASSREGANPPQLVIDGQTIITQRDTTLPRSTFRAQSLSDELVIGGSNGETNNVILIHFALPEQITVANNATLRLYVKRKFSGTHQLAMHATSIDSSLVPPVLEDAPLVDSYASESALCNDAKVLHCEQFEGSISSAWTGDRNDISYVSGYQGMSARNVIATEVHQGANFEYFFAQDQEEVFVRYYVRHSGGYAEDLQGGKQGIGVSGRYVDRSVPASISGCEGKAGRSASGGWGGRTTNGCNGFSARGQWTVDSTNNVNQGTYLYHMDQPGTFGEGIYTGASSVNTWDCMEIQIKMNSRHPNPVQRDGVFRSWRNNQLISSRYSRYTRLPFGIPGVLWNVYHGGKKKAPRPITFDFDNLVVSKTRIGFY